MEERLKTLKELSVVRKPPLKTGRAIRSVRPEQQKIKDWRKVK